MFYCGSCLCARVRVCVFEHSVDRLECVCVEERVFDIVLVCLCTGRINSLENLYLSEAYVGLDLYHHNRNTW